MNMESIQSQTSWSQFLQLTQQARARSSAFHASSVREKKVDNSVPNKCFSMPYNEGTTGGIKQAINGEKVLGGNFDAYA